MQFKNNVNFNKKQLKNAVIDTLSSAPSSPTEGQIYFNDGTVTANDIGFYIRQGSAWKKLTDQSMTDQQILDAVKRVDGTGSGIDADLLDGNSASAFYLATTTLNNIATATGNVGLGGNSITNLKTEIVTDNTTNAATTEFVTRAVANAVQGLDIKGSVTYATVSGFSAWTSNNTAGTITISANPATELAPFDSSNAVVVGQRILVKHFTSANAYLNGFYQVTTSDFASSQIVLTRVDMLYNTSIQANAFVFVERGLTLSDTGWVLTSNSGTVGTDPIAFVQFSSAGVIVTRADGGITKEGNEIYVDTTLIPRKKQFTFPASNTAANTPISLGHNLNTEFVSVSIIEISSKEVVLADVSVTDAMAVAVTFADAVNANTFRAVIIG